MKIILGFNEDYAPHAATLMEELIDQSSVRLSFAILYVSLSGEVMAKLSHHVGPERMAPLAGRRESWASEVYLRLFAPLYIKESRALYIDTDVVCCGDIAPFLTEAQGDYPLHAVREYDEAYKQLPEALYRLIRSEQGDWRGVEAHFQRLCARIGMHAPLRYFNSGMMLIDLDRWRREQITERLLEWVASHDSLDYADQDALNHLMDGRFGVLDPRWNYVEHGFGVMTGYSPEQLDHARRHAVLRHFTGPRKQWTYLGSLRNGAALYWKYRPRTPWPATRPADRTFKRVLVKAFVLTAPPPLKRRARQVMLRWGIAL